MNQIQTVFALEPFLHDFHVQHAEESRNETEAQRLGGFRLEVQRGVVEVQLGQGVPEILVVVRADRKQAGKDARLHLLETRAAALRTAVVHVSAYRPRARRGSP